MALQQSRRKNDFLKIQHDDDDDDDGMCSKMLLFIIGQLQQLLEFFILHEWEVPREKERDSSDNNRMMMKKVVESDPVARVHYSCITFQLLLLKTNKLRRDTDNKTVCLDVEFFLLLITFHYRHRCYCCCCNIIIRSFIPALSYKHKELIILCANFRKLYDFLVVVVVTRWMVQKRDFINLHPQQPVESEKEHKYVYFDKF